MNAILERFSKELDSLSDLFMKHYDEKKDSYQDCELKFLYHKLVEEFNEYLYTQNESKEEIKELQDLILVALMLLSRLKKIKHINIDPLYDVIMENRKNNSEVKNETRID